MANIKEKTLALILKDKRPIEVTNVLIKQVLGFDDMRDFTSELYHWGYQSDFTYNDRDTEDWQRHLRAFLKSYLD